MLQLVLLDYTVVQDTVEIGRGLVNPTKDILVASVLYRKERSPWLVCSWIVIHNDKETTAPCFLSQDELYTLTSVENLIQFTTTISFFAQLNEMVVVNGCST